MKEENPTSKNLIVCPWCYQFVEIDFEDQAICPTCDRLITIEDIENQLAKDEQ